MAQLAMLAGVGLTAAGQYSAGQAAAEQGKMEQEIMNQNALMKERQAKLEVERAREAARQFGQEGEALLAKQQVNFAKGGVLTSTGTPSSLMEFTASELEADRKRILREGFLAESFAKSEAENFRYQGRAARASGLNKRTGYTYGALGSLLTGYGNIYKT